MAVTDADGIIYYRYVYDTYGELSDITTDDGVSLKSSEQLTEYRLAELAHVTGIDYLYNGQYGVETDSNGLYYMRARYYNQDIKRFINRDVVSGDISNSQSLNRYCYVQGNPVSLTDPFGLCPDPNSAFKNFCKFIYNTDWSAIGHAALDVAGIFWDGADVVNALWYALEGNTEMAIASAIFAIPMFGSGIGSLMMKSDKLASAGKAVKAISKMTQSGMGIAAGINMAQIGFTNMLNSIEAGEFSAKDFATFVGGVAIAAISGKGLVSSGKDLMACSDDLSKMWKNTKSRVSENFRKFMNDNGGFLDVDALVGRSKTKTLYRGDSITPDIVFKEGFKPKGRHGDALLHHKFNSMPGDFVSTSKDINVSMDYATAEGMQDGYIYITHADDYIDMNTIYGEELAHPHDREFLIKGRIEASQIEGAIPIDKNYVMGDFIPNPNYKGK